MAIAARLAIHADMPYGTVSPHLYGHFAEHLGRCIYDGIWVGEDSAIPNVGGLRADTIEALRRIGAPNVRWPGGCFADDYHWEDGIGPRAERPRRLNLWWGGEESSEFGTDEFIALCRRVGAEPYLCANVGSGTPAEARNWMEYCNWAGDSALARQRTANGSPEPYGVKWWSVGNENWGCGGHFEPEEYAAAYRRFATYLRRLGGDCQLVACGHTTPDWNRRFLGALHNWHLMDHLSIHRYYSRGHQTEFTEADYLGLLAEATFVGEDIKAAADALDLYAGPPGAGKFIGIVMDEWGVWHPQAQQGLEQINTLRDALAAAQVLDTFNRWSARLTMGNLAQTINVLQCLIHTDGPRFWLTPTYHLFDLYRGHMGQEAVRVVADGPRVPVRRSDGREVQVPFLCASASVNAARTKLHLTLSNRSPDKAAECTVALAVCPPATGAEVRVLAGDDPASHNTTDEPQRVVLTDADLDAHGDTWTWTLPPLSVTGATVNLA